MVYLKSCPRCTTGDVALDRDHYGKHIQCLQCGHFKDLDDVALVDAIPRRTDGGFAVELLTGGSRERMEVV